MKNILILIVAIVGVGGLIALIGHHSTGGSSKSLTSQTTRSTATPGAAPSSAKYKDGSYTGDAVDVGYGPVQVQAVIVGGKITTVNFLQMPSDQPHSTDVTNQSEPVLLKEALSVQTATVDTVSGATATTGGFVQSLGSALKQAS
jgi:uncharacterized protein with FMN-binding domain